MNLKFVYKFVLQIKIVKLQKKLNEKKLFDLLVRNSTKKMTKKKRKNSIEEKRSFDEKSIVRMEFEESSTIF